MNATSKPLLALGVTNGKLAACPDKPNCVSSQATENEHKIAPLQFEGEANAAWTALKSVVAAYPRAKVVSEQDNYLRCEFRTWIMRYVDDVEFLMDADQSVIHVRSASRIGYSDLGANRKRIEQLRTAFDSTLD